jgi:hypothetical protein
MKKLLCTAGFTLLLAAASTTSPAFARSRCDGDFEMVGGSWIATRRCQEHEAQRVARLYHKHISESISSSNDVSPDEFCRGNNDIRVSTYCSSWKD